MTQKTDLRCHHCGYDGEPDLGWQVFSNDTRHLRAECRRCFGYIQYLKQYDVDGNPTEWLLMAPTPPDTGERLL